MVPKKKTKRSLQQHNSRIATQTPSLLAKFFENESELFLVMNTRGGSRAAATSKMERFVIIVNG